MEKGTDFLKSQVNNAVMQHKTFVDSLSAHADQAEDERFAVLCRKYLPRMMQHQRMLEQYQQTLGAEAGTAKKVMGRILEVGKEVVDSARETDFLRLVGDIVMARQSEDTFKTFREAGRQLGIQELARIGDVGEREHDDYVAEANRLAQALFVEHVQVGAAVAR
jgi:hypothetical protein